MQSRRKAREQVLELLYQLDIAGIPLENGVLLAKAGISQEQLVIPAKAGKEPNPFVQELFQSAILHHLEIDGLIRSTVEHWTFDRIAVLDRNILRLAIAELLYVNNIPVQVTINEAVELAKKFSTKDSGKFINGVLDKIVKVRFPLSRE
ncbi:MAG: transcription antitermination factor NusB [bacterium]|nr:transcription antitermination factor NusB [bacterium]